uniref:Uncharacterized protein n=1 Tax=uncultured delta proteobacterium HF0130_19C20 TaxID=710828 RepID=E0XT65_9DELT|nr:hypothetical protein [uncultured delta proteobacterium HF0130_19C20]
MVDAEVPFTEFLIDFSPTSIFENETERLIRHSKSNNLMRILLDFHSTKNSFH